MSLFGYNSQDQTYLDCEQKQYIFHQTRLLQKNLTDEFKASHVVPLE